MKRNKFFTFGLLGAVAMSVFFCGCEAKKEEKKSEKKKYAYDINLSKDNYVLNFARVDEKGDVVKADGKEIKTELELVKIKAGSFNRGCSKKPCPVTLTNDFWIGKYEVTQRQWELVMGENPSYFKGKDNSSLHPVENVSWSDAKKFCDKLNQIYAGKLPAGYKFDLPTEAQWEYACRAGEEGEPKNVGEVAWFLDNAEGSTHVVGKKTANAWGLYDMRGNVWEWCRDGFEGDKIYAADPEFLVGNKSVGLLYIGRGGCWGSEAQYNSSSFRHSGVQSRRSYDFGFRLALVPENK